eukprot:TRINITY_DN3755_c0_g1_i4.p1 TRINITY_DN3755_c0_g1~~TRINITY_DN3755_c0_g1_i4.p1  ORF type:complete len:114 (-),score=37.73 TRINITY_DN3755_c0_g1_i4:311-652(-)
MSARKRKAPDKQAPSGPDQESVRKKARELLQKAIAASESAFGFEEEDFEAVAQSVEQAAYETLEWGAYKSKCRSLCFNLKKADQLVLSLLLGQVTGAQAVQAGDEVRTRLLGG